MYLSLEQPSKLTTYMTQAKQIENLKFSLPQEHLQSSAAE